MKTFHEWANEKNPQQFKEIFGRLKKFFTDSDEVVKPVVSQNYKNIVKSIQSRNNKDKNAPRSLNNEFPGLTKKRTFSSDNDNDDVRWIG